MLKWCNSVHSVMREMLLAAEYVAMGGNIFTRLCQQLYKVVLLHCLG